MYFITICTQNRECFFGEIYDGKMQLNNIGKIVNTEWLKTFELRTDMNLQMGEFVVMPNHFHAIIIIGDNEYNMDAKRGGRDERDERGERRDAMHCVSTTTTNDTDSVNTTNHVNNKQKNKFGSQSKNLASIVRGFKSSVTTYARKNGNIDFGWQSRFHDHIIRNQKSFNNISNYIINNPKKWNEDKFHKQL